MSSHNFLWGIVLLLIGLTAPANLSGQSSCRAQDSLILVSFARNSLSQGWNEKWDLSQPMDTWYGIKLNAAGCVECIDMDGNDDCQISVSFGNGLAGSLDPALANLNSLKKLFLGNNRISGTIPSPILDMNQLEVLDLFANEMIGPLPATLGNADNLQILSVAGNNLTGVIPPSVGDLKNLTDLYADNNQIIGPLPSSLGNATELRKVRLHKNKINGSIPTELGQLTNLVSLNLAQNLLTGSIPSSFGNMLVLEDLVLESNQLSGIIPPEIGNCAIIKRIRICHNQLVGPIPSTIENMTELVLLHANDNQLSSSIPPEIGSCLQLNDLQLDHNQLSGEVPREVGFCGNMRKINLSFNNIIGPLPRSIQNMKQLQELLVTDNELSGPLPEEIADMTSLRTLRAQNNNIIGPLPSRVDQLQGLQEMNLQNNKIDGTIPDAYGQVPRLYKLYLNNNKLEGCFPPSLQDDCDKDYNFLENSRLPWEGELQMFCDDNEQIGAPCSSDPNIEDEEIQPDCECLKFVCAPTVIVLDAFLCENETLTTDSGSYSEAGTITDSLYTRLGCDSIVVLNIAKMDIEIATQEAQCSNEPSGSAKVSSNWAGSFDYVVSNQAGETILSGSEETALPDINSTLEPGFYRMQLMEVDMECSIDTFFEIGALYQPAQDSYIQGIQCDGESYEINGVTYDRNNISGTEVLNTVNGCDSTIVIDLVYLQLETEQKDIDCEGENDGSISGSMTAEGNYKVTIYDESGSIVHQETTAKDFASEQELKSGNYSISVVSTDKGCNYTDDLLIVADNIASEPVLVEQTLCQDETLMVNGVTYSQANPEGTEILITDSGCDSIVTIALKYLELTASKENTQCENDETGMISGIMSETGVYQVVIESQDGTVVFNESTDQNFTTNNSLKPGTYSVVISAETGCEYQESVTIISEYRTPEPVVMDQVLCADEEIMINGQIYSQDNQSGTEYLTTATGCDSIINVSLEVLEEPLALNDIHNAGPEIDVFFDVLENDLFQNREDVTIEIIGETKIVDVLIENAGLAIQLDKNYSGISTIEYELCITDCEELCTRAVLTITSQKVGYDSDILTPNEDGYNDMLVVKGYEEYEQIPNASINVVNRWGQVVFSSDDYHNDWKGTHQSQSDKELPEGVYYYHLILDNGISLMGSRSLIR